MATRRLALDAIVLDDSLYPRSQPDWLLVYRYGEAMQAGAAFPHVVVGVRRGAHVCLDGRHRVLAARKLGLAHLTVDLSPAKPSQFFAEAVRLNAQHGRPLSTQERVGAAQRLKHEGMKLADIAETLWMPVSTIERLLIERVEQTPEGEVIRKGPVPAGKLARPSQQYTFTGRNQLSILGQALALVEHELLDTENEEVLATAERLRGALNQWAARRHPEEVEAG
jgi:hypothetical protein